jgi:hypothetical protein
VTHVATAAFEAAAVVAQVVGGIEEFEPDAGVVKALARAVPVAAERAFLPVGRSAVSTRRSSSPRAYRPARIFRLTAGSTASSRVAAAIATTGCTRKDREQQHDDERPEREVIAAIDMLRLLRLMIITLRGTCLRGAGASGAATAGVLLGPATVSLQLVIRYWRRRQSQTLRQVGTAFRKRVPQKAGGATAAPE